MCKVTIEREGSTQVVEMSEAALTLLYSCVEVGFDGAEDAEGVTLEDVQKVGEVLHALRTLTKMF